ncbi:zinc-dependent alcohol dehydrogenase family protein [Mycolicibacterium brisbanense]|uniref:Alcohol dehydrogenase n=1 Tax=Mycolicibacterium brisbanense TaxID=146020 RepID=A0A100VTQ1_9MYCO|nr:zinc-dependent alcohol dehydrogenase family protein [Mycolicibacterium brisbanense]MCV7160466.1 zinc-dependent alcohol dehydrogenase family protein [Mycolicibacterium brisbanense]GAS85936.1 alcohol dehydrogenase [Mycolicibacterium brisbanense]
MRAVVYPEVGVLPTVVDVADPQCPADGVIIDVAATGVCRSDWHAWRGHDPVEVPIIPGHEFAGTIAAVGTEVTGWQVGERVTVPFVLGCGLCEYCVAGDAQVCPDQLQPGFTLPGSFARQVAVPRAQTNLVRLPDTVSFVAAAALGCRFATSFRAVVTHGAVRPGQWVAVHGCGGVGLSAVMIAKAFGANVVAVDRSAEALATAGALGADELINGAEIDDVATEVVHRTGGGAHIGVDAIGHPAVAAASVSSLRRRGRHVQVGLLLGDAAQTALPMDRVIAHELAVLGSHGMPAVDYPAMLELLASGALDPERLVTRVVGLDEAGAALAAMDAPTGPGMTIIEPCRSA